MLAYIDILKNDSKFKAKVAYSLCCLQSSIQPSNANREANLQFLASHTELLIKVGKIYADADVLGNLVSIFNELQQFGVSND